jgi:hypothetical protein
MGNTSLAMALLASWLTATAADRPPAPGFRHFSDNLYCSGAEERLCASKHSRTGPGECNWFSGSQPVTQKQMDPNEQSARAQWPRHRWDPVAAGAVSASAFPMAAGAIQQCFRRKRIHFAGDSTTRAAYQLLLGELKLTEVNPRAMPMARQRETVSAPDGTRLSFQFFAIANKSQEVELGRSLNQGRQPDAIFVLQLVESGLCPA